MIIIVVILLIYSISTFLYPRISPVFNSTTLSYRRGRYSQLLVNEINNTTLIYRHGGYSQLLISEILKNRNSTKTISFKPYPRSGFGNHIRGMRGVLLLAILNDARICVDYDTYFDIMQPSLSILKCDSIEGRLIDVKAYHSMLVNMKCMPILSEKKVIISSYENAYGYLLKCDSVKSMLEKKGLWRKDIEKKITQFLFQLVPYLENYGKSVLNRMNGMRIGIQLRFGGSIANTKERVTFLNITNFNSTLERIKSILSKYPDNHSLFLSTDSNKTVSLLFPLHERIITADKFALGHTYVKNAFLERTVIDLYILSHCDVIITTTNSSYGDLAAQLAQTNEHYYIK